MTVVEVLYPPERGVIGLRGSHEPLSWDETTQPSEVDGNRSVFRLPIAAHALLELKVVRNEGEAWANGRNYVVHAGDNLVIEPSFDREDPELVGNQELGDLLFDVLLPPGYEEQLHKHYPVLYVLDGQSLWSTSEDPFGVWGMEIELARLFELDVVEELIVVGIHTADRRVERLTPVPDEEEGGAGGEGEAFLAQITDELKPHIDGRFRTKGDRHHTGVMGSSLGGLFAFYAALQRPDVFGKAACLSSSFWWANRWAVRWAASRVSVPRPVLYLDSGAAFSGLEQDASVKDGFHHTRSMFRTLIAAGYDADIDLHRLVFTGARHEAAAWAARVGLPLQLLFPAEVHYPRALRDREKVVIGTPA